MYSQRSNNVMQSNSGNALLYITQCFSTRENVIKTQNCTIEYKSNKRIHAWKFYDVLYALHVLTRNNKNDAYC